LHPADTEVLVRCLDRVIECGGSVIAVEHNLDVICAADYIIDIGPEGGPGGGELIVCGTPSAVADCARSLTGAALRGPTFFRLSLSRRRIIRPFCPAPETRRRSRGRGCRDGGRIA